MIWHMWLRVICWVIASLRTVYSLNLIKAIESGVLPNVDKHPPFRELMRTRHKAFACTQELVEWCYLNLGSMTFAIHFMLEPVADMVSYMISHCNWMDY